MTNNDDVNVETLAETESYAAWLSRENDGEIVYHVELGAVTLHFYREEWEEVVALIEAANKAGSGRR
ncbi:MAG: hypothetical protein J0M07_23310 [Anaerolineae bacterium]|nr:hypothetical protein [Anaerolineae bacterium]